MYKLNSVLKKQKHNKSRIKDKKQTKIKGVSRSKRGKSFKIKAVSKMWVFGLALVCCP